MNGIMIPDPTLVFRDSVGFRGMVFNRYLLYDHREINAIISTPIEIEETMYICCKNITMIAMIQRTLMMHTNLVQNDDE